MVKATTAKPGKKTTNKVHSKKKIFYIFGAIVLAIIFFALGYSLYQQYLDRNDAAKFATLKQDMQDLQKEFNKIDPGWVYSEGCTSPHFVFNTGSPSCKVMIQGILSSGDNRDKYISIAEKIVGKADATVTDNSSVRKSLKRPGFDTPGDGYCAIDLAPSEQKPYILCVNQARNYYFENSN